MFQILGQKITVQGHVNMLESAVYWQRHTVLDVSCRVRRSSFSSNFLYHLLEVYVSQ